MKPRGRIIGIASNLSIPSPSYSYNNAKRARIESIIGIVQKFWDNHITIYVVTPWPVKSIGDMDEAHKFASGDLSKESRVTPQDVAEAVSYFCSDSARYVTGNVLEPRF
jgi:NAD(P)-dependent dehydrogenase (short-subunit alcohol dehydrogenase family)